MKSSAITKIQAIIVIAVLVVCAAIGGIYFYLNRPTVVLKFSAQENLPIKLTELTQMFTEETGIEVEITSASYGDLIPKFMTDMMSGASTAAYDVVMVARDGMKLLADGGYLAIHDDLASKYKPLSWGAVQWETFYYNGHYYAVPTNLLGSWIFYWNTEAFEEAGLPDRPPETYDELVDWAAKLTVEKGGMTERWGWFEALATTNAWAQFQIFVENYGSSVWNEDETRVNLTSPAAIAAVEMIKEALDSKGLSPESLTYTSTGQKGTAFQAGLGAMLINWPYQWGWNDDPEKSNVIGKWKAGIVPGTTAMAMTDAFAITAKAAHPEEAKRFLEFIWSDEVQREYAKSGLPLTSKILDETATPISQLIKETATKRELGYPWHTADDQAIVDVFEPWFHKALYGIVDIPTAMANAENEANDILASP